MSLLLTNRSATVQGLPRTGNSLSCLRVDGIQLHPESLYPLFNSYCSDFTWGYVGTGPGCTALAISYALFTNKHLAPKLARLIEADYVLHWPFNQAFSQDIDLVDFCIRHQDYISQAQEDALLSSEQE